MPTLSLDLLFVEILPRLPAKSLLRFRYVSKSFHAAISSRKFVKLYQRYLSLSSKPNNLLVIPRSCSIVCYSLASYHTLATVSRFPWSGSLVSVVGSSDGLLCIFVIDDIKRLFVLNPTTHMFKNVSYPSNGELGHKFVFGFAFDHKNFDYKIVTVSDTNNGSQCDTRTTKVYSLDSDRWRTVDFTIPNDSMKGRRDGVLIDSHLLHWVFWKDCNPSTKARIGCFDVCKMKWANDVRLPRYYNHPDHNNHLLDIGVFDDRLFSSFENRADSCFDVWVMKDYGVQDSWFKLLSIPVSNDLQGGVVPIMYRVGSTEILVRQGQGSGLFRYNSRNCEMIKAEFLETPKDSNHHQVYLCSQSLVDIPRGELLWNQW